MARFEVYIPATEPDGMNMTLRVTADTWMAALKVGLKKIGDAEGIPNNVLCDIQDDESIHVTDPRRNRVFRIQQIPEVSNPGLVPGPTGPWMAAPTDPQPGAAPDHAERAAAERATAERAAAERLAAERAQAEKLAAERAAAELAAAAAKAAEERAASLRASAEKEAAEARLAAALGAADKAVARARADRESADKAAAQRVLAEQAAAERAAQARAASEKATLEHQAAEQRAAAERAAEAKAAADARAAADKAERERVAREKAERVRLAQPPSVKVVAVPKPKAPPPSSIGRTPIAPAETLLLEDALADLFERTPELFTKSKSDALYFLLDLAMEKVPSDSGTVYVADLNRHDLGFAAVRGPKAAELLALKLRVPMGKGFVGFCAQEGVAVAISDVQRDKRFFREISDRIGYETRSLLTTPIILHGRTLGAIQLINKQGSSSYTQGELSVLHYLAHQGALLLEAREE